MKIGFVLCGVILGVLASFALRPLLVQAQSRGGPLIIEEARVGGIYNSAGLGDQTMGRTVVGFSCVPTESGPKCFVASR